ncbi:MAG: putative molybdenum carrier protein [Pyrinomonadaceae bacterium]|nr:putative molybdenum carrier protein [Pyrinomonadaceae bacterium]
MDAAIASGVEIGGFVPRGRWAEDGPIAAEYPGLIEIASGDPAQRTRLNVEHSDGTVIFSHGKLSGGSALTARFARDLKKPYLHIDLLACSQEAAIEKLRLWIKARDVSELNVAGPRASSDPFIYGPVRTIIERLLTDGGI